MSTPNDRSYQFRRNLHYTKNVPPFLQKMLATQLNKQESERAATCIRKDIKARLEEEEMPVLVDSEGNALPDTDPSSSSPLSRSDLQYLVNKAEDGENGDGERDDNQEPDDPDEITDHQDVDSGPKFKKPRHTLSTRPARLVESPKTDKRLLSFED